MCARPLPTYGIVRTSQNFSRVGSCQAVRLLTAGRDNNSNNNNYNNLRFSFATVGNSHIKFWSLDKSKPRNRALTVAAGRFRQFPQQRTVHCLAYHPTDSDVAFSGGSEGNIAVWNGKSCVNLVEAHPRGPLRYMFASTTGVLTTAGHDAKVLTWHLSDLNKGPVAAVTMKEELSTTSSTVGNVDGVEEKQLSLVSRKPARPKRTVGRTHSNLHADGGQFAAAEHVARIVCLAQVPKGDGSGVVTYCGPSRCNILRVKGRGSELFVAGHCGPLYGMCTHPSDSHVFVTVGEDMQICVWNTKRKKLLRRRALPRDAIARSVHVSPNGEHAAVGLVNGCFIVVDFHSLAVVHVQQRCREAIDDIKYSPTGGKLAVASHDNFIDLYDVFAGYQHVARCSGHSSYVTHVDWSNDGQLLQSNDGAYEIMWWNANTGRACLSSTDSVEKDTKWAAFT